MRTEGKRRRGQRGAALVIAMVLILALTMVVAATQYMAVQELRLTRSERNYERALQMAEAGANAYLNQLAKGFVNTSGGGAYDFMPPYNDVSSASPAWPVDFATFRSLARAGTAPFDAERNYPAGTTGQGYVVGHIQSGPDIKVISYGFCNGAVRMVIVSASSFSIFDWAAAYGIDKYNSSNPGPSLSNNANQTDTGPAWNFGGGTSLVGASGAEGLISNSNNATWYDGPIFLAANGNTFNPSNTFNPTILQSLPNVPTGHVGTGTVASPGIRRFTRTLSLPTADEAANEWALTQFATTTTAGTRWFATNQNNNLTGIRWLVRVTNASDPNFNKIRELPIASNTFGNSTTNPIWSLGTTPTNGVLNAAGRTNNETLFGVRIYPGNYFFTQIQQASANGPTLYIRSYADGGTGTDLSGNNLVVYKSDWSGIATNPNSGMASEKNIRIWMGDPSPLPANYPAGSDRTNFSNNIWMENQAYPSRFRLYSGNRAGITITGTSSPKFNVNMLVYNKFVPTSGPFAGQTVFYGDVSLTSSTYLYGSLLAWKVSTTGSPVIEKQATMEPGNADRLTFLVTGWREIQ